MRHHITRRAAVAAVATATVIGLGATPTSTAAPAAAQAQAQAGIDQTTAIVQLTGDPLSTHPRTRPAPGKKIDFSSASVRAERAELAKLRAGFKSWLRANAPDAKVVNEYDIALNAVAVHLNGTPLSTLRGAPQVVRAEHEQVYSKLDADDPDLALVRAVEAWRGSAVGGDANAGRGVKIGILDTGVDHTHPCFSDAGFPATQQLGDRRFTNNKVIVAKVFNMVAHVRGLTAEAIQDHGTHVAGTAACNLDTPATVRGVDIPYDVSGVAPAAQVGNYNVFPGDVLSVRTEDLVDAMEEAYADGMDVINMSIGGAASGAQDFGTVAVDNLDRANMVVAVAAGNAGPGHYTVESAGSAERALTAGASTVGHFVGPVISVGGSSYPATVGDFPVVPAPLTAPAGVVTGSVNGLGLACDALPAGSLTGKIAIFSRGTCSFATKLRRVQDAGAVAGVIVNNVAGDPIAPGGDATVQPQPTIPAYMVGKAAGPALAGVNGQATTIGSALSYFRSGNDNIMAGFSSQGPTDTSARRVKPDVVAPGVNVLSSIPANHCGGDTDCWAFMQGTSMATPHLAGMAAVIRGAHPGWTAEQVRSAIVNTAADGVLTRYTDGATVENDVNVSGSGLADLVGAVGARVAVGPVSTSFGSVPGGAGQTRTATVALSSLTGSAQTLTLSVDSAVGSGVTFSAPTTVTVPASGSVSVQVRATVVKGATAGDKSAMLRVKAGGVEIAHSVLYVFVS
ncbi:S8 family serine peptidase [Actinokineospora soli]|uniref:S8 family serine peptidase n=1 Tax=Actinokineospora soli TaxID=1048753 RepID=A0ABW2TUJ2_9PSEU